MGNNRPYKVVPFTDYGTRFCVIDPKTGEILDDAQGYGYKTKQKAHAGWAYKNKSKKEKRHDREVEEWLKKKEQRPLRQAMDDNAWYALKDCEDFNTAMVKDILKELKVETNFTAYEVLRAWRRL